MNFVKELPSVKKTLLALYVGAEQAGNRKDQQQPTILPLQIEIVDFMSP